MIEVEEDLLSRLHPTEIIVPDLRYEPLAVRQLHVELAALPYYEFHPLGVERKRAETIRRACSVADRLEEAAHLDPRSAQQRITAIPGIGRWTAAEVARVALGDADAVSLDDYNLPHLVSWMLAGERRGSDERMLELLEPYSGQRGRVARILEIAGPRPPRRGPRHRLRHIERI